MAVSNARVLFSYVPSGKTKPAVVDENTIYFIADTHEIHVGSVVIARDATESIPSFVIDGTGDFIANAAWDSSTNTLTLTKGTLPVYTVTKASSADTGYSATYQLFKDGTAVGDKINIPKDMVVESGSVVDITYSEGKLWDNGVDVTEIIKGEGGTATAADAGKYIKLVVANATDDKLYIKANDLVDVYTGGTHISISNNAINHDAQGSDASTPLGTDVIQPTSGQTGALHVSGQVEYDDLGHVISVADKDIFSSVQTIASDVADAAIADLDVAAVGGAGQYVTTISETDGKINASVETADTTVTSGSTNLVTSGAVYTAVANATAVWSVVS